MNTFLRYRDKIFIHLSNAKVTHCHFKIQKKKKKLTHSDNMIDNLLHIFLRTLSKKNINNKFIDIFISITHFKERKKKVETVISKLSQGQLLIK